MQTQKRIGFALALVFLLQMLLVPGVMAAPQNIQVLINGEEVAADPAPVIIDGRVMVPVRLAEKLQAKVEWDEEERKVTVNRGFNRIELWIPGDGGDEYGPDPEMAMVNGQYEELEVAPVVIKGRTFIPLRLIAEGLGAKVDWDGNNRRVTINIAEIKPLTGLAKTVRDAAYNTSLAKSFESTFDLQFKLSEYPQLNFIKMSGKQDKAGHSYSKGHALGFGLEAIYANQMLYIKSPLFNDKWVGLDEFGPQGKQIAEEFKGLQNEYMKAQDELNAVIPDFLTELVRVLGEPKVVAEETIGGVVAQKIEFKPTWESYQELKKLDGVEKISNLKFVIWVDKDGQYLRKIDFYVEISEAGKSGWAHIIAEYANFNSDSMLEIPAEILKK